MTWNIGYLLFFFALNIIKSFWHPKFRRIDVIYSYFSKNTIKLKIIIRLKKMESNHYYHSLQFVYRFLIIEGLVV